MKPSFAHSLLASTFITFLALALVVAPVSGSPIRQPRQVPDVLPLPSPAPSQTPTPLPSPAVPSVSFSKQEKEVRNRAKALNKTLTEERTVFEEKWRQQMKDTRAANQKQVDNFMQGRHSSEFVRSHTHIQRLRALGVVFDAEMRELAKDYIEEKNTLLRAQRDQAEAVEAEWKTLTGGKKKLGVDFAFPAFEKPMDHKDY
ncbi:hypothetical protein B0T14DRAFT_491391 [Immersiella caudata]|uniref:Uncharacterized protein n=1 Tax=Immersiella caudata TaxID=314043 RepID=A0AA40CD84_9PEZI|nr:hypothetical protein B0T14DRAFT_491391 [Immersiella caudata]